ncbi:MAG: hypothetical protein AB8G95_03830 [Anaerolineae bacterium]
MNANNPNRRNILIGLSVFVVVLLISLIGLGIYFYRLSNTDTVIDGGVAVLPTQLPTATAFPTKTPTPTPTPLPTETPLPPPTATPQPLAFSITGPKFVPAGLPLQVEWVIKAIDGDGSATVILDDLGGAMLTGDESGNVVIARSLANAFSENTVVGYDQEFILKAIVDPNIKSGVVSLEIRNSFFAEPVLIPWLAIDDTEVTYQTFEIVLDGIEDEVQAIDVVQEVEPESSSTADEADDSEEPAEPVNPDYQLFQSRTGVELEFPETWFMTESQDGILDLSTEPINPETIQLPGEGIFANIFTGKVIDFGLVADGDVDPETIKELLLGVTIPTGEADNEVFVTETGLEIIEEVEFELPDGHKGIVTHLQTPAAFAVSGETPFESIFAVIVQGENIIIMNGYTPEDEPDQLEILKTIAGSLRFVDTNDTGDAVREQPEETEDSE